MKPARVSSDICRTVSISLDNGVKRFSRGTVIYLLRMAVQLEARNRDLELLLALETHKESDEEIHKPS